jgi:predicted ribosome quality control (RQC) complex YloA/Tae2 family protein
VLRKKEFTSFDVAAVVRELKEAILDSRVSNVYQLDSKTLLFNLHKPEKPIFGLVLESGRRLHLTAYALEKPLTPPAFCMALRKYLRNGWLTGITQYEFERIIIFTIKTKAGELRLILELFGDGNIILVGEKDEILQALTYKRMRDRNILRGESFVFAPSSGKNPFKVGREEFREGLRGFGDVEVVRALARFLSIGGVYAEEVLLRAGVDKTEHCNVLTGSEVNAVFDSLQGLLSQVLTGKLEPCVVLDESGGFVDVVPVRLRRCEGFAVESYGSFNEALDEFYVRIAAVEKATAGLEVEELKREEARLKRIVESQEKALAETNAEAVKDRSIGDAIYAHVGELQALLNRFIDAKKGGKEWDSVVGEVLAEKRSGLKPSVFFESFDGKGSVVSVCVDGLWFGLGLREGLFEGAGRFYERSKRAKQKLEGAKAALEGSRKMLAEVEGKIREAETAERVKPVEVEEELVKRRVRHKEWFEKFRWFVSSDGFLVVAGKDAVSNEVLIKKHAEKDDIVFHADVMGAPFVVVKTEGKKPSEQCLHEAGEFAAAFSRGWREGFGSVDVYWVKPEQLSKGGPSGESVPRGGFVVRGERNWMRNVALRVAVGVTVNEEEGLVRVGGGPVDAVRTKADVYVVVVPGDVAGKEVVRRVLGGLAVKLPKELREIVVKASVEAVREFIPFGKGRITE